MPTLRNEKNIYSADQPTVIFMLSYPQTNKLNWFRLTLRKIKLYDFKGVFLRLINVKKKKKIVKFNKKRCSIVESYFSARFHSICELLLVTQHDLNLFCFFNKIKVATYLKLSSRQRERESTESCCFILMLSYAVSSSDNFFFVLKKNIFSLIFTKMNW